jgi:3-carboxy-cis,cis-muconate cycloisomerase
MSEVLRGLQVDAGAMRRNLERTNGLVFSEALALRVSRPLAERLCEQAARSGESLLEVARADPEVRKRLKKGQLEALFEAQNQFGAARAMIERVLEDWATSRETAA